VKVVRHPADNDVVRTFRPSGSTELVLERELAPTAWLRIDRGGRGFVVSDLAGAAVADGESITDAVAEWQEIAEEQYAYLAENEERLGRHLASRLDFLRAVLRAPHAD
jgi:hypothetical protein